MRRIFFSILIACSGSSGAVGGTVSGSVEGKNLSPNDAFAVVAQVKDNGNNVAFVRVGIFNQAGYCNSAKAGKEPGNLTGLILEVRHEDLSAMPPAIAPGMYTIGTALQMAGGSSYFENVTGRFVSTDGMCHNTIKAGGAASGRITLDAVGSTIRGSYSIRTDSGDALNGTFDVPICNVPIPTETACSG